MNLGLTLMHVALVGVLQAQGGAAPRSVTIPYRISCPACRIDVTQVATLAPNGLNSTSGGMGNVQRDSRGRYFAVEQQMETILVYDARGMFLRSLGRTGAGPGEFTQHGATRVRVGKGDSVYVVDAIARRLSVFDSSLKFVRQVRIPAPTTGIVVLADGGLVLNTPIRTPDRVGFPFHSVNGAGSITRSFGPRSTYTGQRGGPPPPPPIPLRLAADGRTVWAIRMQPLGFAVSAWTIASGEPAWTAQVTDVPWLPKVAQPQRVSTPSPPRRRTVADMHRAMDSLFKTRSQSSVAAAGLAGIDEAGLLWVNWSIPTAADSTRFRYVVDVVDLRAGTVLASRDVAQPLTLIGGGYAHSSVADADGIRTAIIYRVELRRP
jgi:hypothetical protein